MERCRTKNSTGRTKSGEQRTSLVSCERIKLAGQSCVVFTCKDLSQLHQSEAARRDSDRQFQLAVQHLLDGFVIYDRDRRIQYINEAGLEATGLSLEQAIGRRDEDLFPPEVTSAYLPMLQRALDTKTLQSENCAFQQSNSAAKTLTVKYVPWLNQQGEVDRVFGIIYDMTSRKQAENTLRESERHLRLLADSLPVLISYIDTEQRYQFVNKTYETFFGISRDLIPGKQLIEIVGEAYYCQVQGYVERALAGETVSYEATILKGQPRELSVILAPNVNQDSQVEGFYTLAIDISDRKLTEIALQRSQAAADAASRAKSAFLSSMSHELRTPLNAILGFAQLLHGEETLTRSQQNQIGTILRSGEHLLALINDVLEVSKIDAGRMDLNLEDFDLHWFLEDLKLSLCQKAENKGLQFQLERDANLPQFIHSDRVKLRQVLSSLLGNAIKFTQDGHVVLRVRADAATNPNIPLVFGVEDTGIGIAAEELERIFEPFVQSESLESPPGTGLGLTLSRRYAQLLGGEITASSSVDRGSVFQLKITVLPGEANLPSAPPQRVLGLEAGQTCRLLVVEDDPDSRNLVVLLLSNLGFEVREACNGQEAIGLWQSWSPQVILMDMQMPVLNGYDTARQIRAMERQRAAKPDPASAVPIVALTASVFEEQRAEILAAGCNAVVCKPFRLEALYETIAQYSGSQYIYHDNPDPEASAAGVNLPLQRSDLEGMPPAWRQEFYQAATCLFEHKCHELVALIPGEQGRLRQQLDRLIQEFRFDRLIELTRE